MTTDAFQRDVARHLGDTRVAGIRFVTDYGSAIGPTVTPPAGTLRVATSTDQYEVAGEFELAGSDAKAVTVDSWASQASRMEAAVEEIAERTGFPLVRFFSAGGELLTTSVRWSHRHADATWRGCRADLKAAGVPFEEIQRATTGDAAVLLRWFPTALLFGWWHSHTRPASRQDAERQNADRAKKIGGNTKLAEALEGYARLGEVARSARVVTAEIVAYDVHRRLRMAARVDSLFGPLKKNMSAVGLGSLPPVRENRAPVDVTFGRIEGSWYLSLAGLRRYGFGDTDPDDAHALLVALALLLRVSAQRHSRLRAGAELVVEGERRELLVHGEEPQSFGEPTYEELCDIVRELGARVGWNGPVDVHLPEDSFVQMVHAHAEAAEPGSS